MKKAGQGREARGRGQRKPLMFGQNLVARVVLRANDNNDPGTKVLPPGTRGPDPDPTTLPAETLDWTFHFADL